MSLLPTTLIPANYVNAGVINSFKQGTDDFETDQDGQGLKITNKTTGGYLEIGAGGFIISPDGTTQFPITLTNLSAIADNPTPLELVIVDTLVVQNDDTTPTENIQVQAGINGGVGTFFGIDYESATNQDFVFQTTASNAGGVLFNQFGLGAGTTETRIKNGQIAFNDTASTDKASNISNITLQFTDTTSHPYDYNATLNGTSLNLNLIDNATNSWDLVLNPTSLLLQNNDATGTANLIQTTLTSTTEKGQITCYDSNHAVSVPFNVVASEIQLNGVPIGGGGGSQDLNSVLSNGNNAGGQNITNVGDIACSSINSTSYPPPTPDLTAVLGAGNNASSYDINGVNNLNCNSINGLTPITLGLTWSDFTASNAYSNLPNQAYEVYSYPYTSSQFADRFQVYNSSIPDYSYLYSNSLQFYDQTSSTTTTYGTNNISSTNGTDFTITAGSGSSQILNLNCSQLVINGTPYAPSTQPIRYYSNASTSFSVGSGSWTNVGVGSSPIFYISGLNPYTAYTFSINFSVITNGGSGYEPTGSVYLSFNNDTGGYTPTIFTSSTPMTTMGDNNSFGAGSNNQFVMNDTITFNSGMSGAIGADMYFGHNGGSWSGNYYWSVNGIQIS